jgi:hypothetical protein
MHASAGRQPHVAEDRSRLADGAAGGRDPPSVLVLPADAAEGRRVASGGPGFA